MLFDSNFSFAPKPSREGRPLAPTLQVPTTRPSKPDTLQLSPHSKAEAVRTSQRSRSRSRPFRSSSRNRENDHLSPPPSSSGSIGSQSSTSSAVAPDSRPRTPGERRGRAKKFFRSRRGDKNQPEVFHIPRAVRDTSNTFIGPSYPPSDASYDDLDVSDAVPDENADAVIAAISMDMEMDFVKSNRSRPKEISAPIRTSLLSAFPPPPKPPVLKLEPSPLPKQQASDGPQENINHSLLSPFQTRPPVTTQTREQSAYRHSQTADFFGVQMLANSLDEDSEEEDSEEDEEEEEEELDTEDESFAPRQQKAAPRNRLEIPMPAIDESVETASETSSLSDSFGPDTPVSGRSHRLSLTPTLPTSISGSSGASSTHSVPKRRSVSSSKGLLSLSNAGPGASLGGANLVAPRTQTLSEVPSLSLSSRRGSTGTTNTTATFFCRGNRSSFISNCTSIGLGSIAASDIDLEAGLENVTYFPGMDELKKQISWLALRGPQVYSSDDEDEIDEAELNNGADYHEHLASLVTSPALSRRSTGMTIVAAPAAAPYVRPTGPILETPPRRRNRRRTASSECIVLEVLEEIWAADRRESLEREQRKQQAPKATSPAIPAVTNKRYSTATMHSATSTENRRYSTVPSVSDIQWYSAVPAADNHLHSAVSDAVAWERALSSNEIGFCI